MESPEDNFVFHQIVAPVTWEEISFMQEFEIEDGDGTIDCKEFMILAVVRIGSISPELIRRINERFKQLDRKRQGKIAYDDLIVGRRKSVGAKSTKFNRKPSSGKNNVVVADDVSSVRFSNRTSVSYKARNSSVFARRAKSVFAANGTTGKAEIESNIAKIKQLTQHSKRHPVNQVASDCMVIHEFSGQHKGECYSSDDDSDETDSYSRRRSGRRCSFSRSNLDRDHDSDCDCAEKVFGNENLHSAGGDVKTLEASSNGSTATFVEEFKDNRCTNDIGMVDGHNKVVKSSCSNNSEIELHDPSPVALNPNRKRPDNTQKVATTLTPPFNDNDSGSEDGDVLPDLTCATDHEMENGATMNSTTMNGGLNSMMSENGNVTAVPPVDNNTKHDKLALAKKQRRMSQQFVALAQQVHVENNVQVKSKKNNKLQQAKKDRRRSLVEAHRQKKKRWMERICVQFMNFAKSNSAFALYAWLLWLSAGTVFYCLEEDLTVCEALYVSTSIGYGIFWHELTSNNTYAKVYTSLHFCIGVFGVAFAMAIFAGHLVTIKKKWFNEAKQQRSIRVALTTDELWDDFIALYKFYWPKVYAHIFFVIWMVLGIVGGSELAAESTRCLVV